MNREEDDDESTELGATNLAANNQFCYVGNSATSPENNNIYFNGDSVLCRARAKRGCATHPRSIAERVCHLYLPSKFSCFCFFFLHPFSY